MVMKRHAILQFEKSYTSSNILHQNHFAICEGTQIIENLDILITF